MSLKTEPRDLDHEANPPRPRAPGPVARQARRLAFLRGPLQKKIAAGVGLTLCAVAAVAVLAAVWGSSSSSLEPLIFHTVQRGELPIRVTERGNLESQDNVEILCEVDDIHGDGIPGTPIEWIVPNGTSVTKGDVLIQLAAAGHQERLDRQILDTERARAEQIKAKVRYENQRTQNETNLAEAQLQVELAQLALKQFEDEEGGTFQIELQNVELQIREAQAGQLIEETNLEGVEQLYKLGYRSSGELAQARLSALRAKRQLATAISRRKELTEYQYLKNKMELQGKLDSAKRALAQVLRDNEALLEQARAAMEAADEALKKEEELLARYREYVEKCKIYAPQDGMVAYAVSRNSWRTEEIREGASVRLRQILLTLPNLTRMQVKTAVHESVLDQIKPDLPATIRVDAFPDKSYRGTVKSVAVLPDQGSWMSSDTKVYETIVTIDEDVERLKPGMTAVVDIHVALLRDVLSVPVQAIDQIKNDCWCYVEADGGLERRLVTLGSTNEKFVEVRTGLAAGDRVVLNPMAILGDREGATPEDDGEAPEEAGEPLEPREAAGREAAPPDRPDERPGAPPPPALSTEGSARRAPPSG